MVAARSTRVTIVPIGNNPLTKFLQKKKKIMFVLLIQKYKKNTLHDLAYKKKIKEIVLNILHSLYNKFIKITTKF